MGNGLENDYVMKTDEKKEGTTSWRSQRGTFFTSFTGKSLLGHELERCRAGTSPAPRSRASNLVQDFMAAAIYAALLHPEPGARQEL